jgi:hypothetical protein
MKGIVEGNGKKEADIISTYYPMRIALIRS